MNEEFKLSRYNVKNINSFNVSGTVIYNGTDNLFPNYLDGLYLKSVTHQTIINDLVNYILGYGLQSPSEEEQRIIKKFFNKRALNKLLRYKLIHNAYVLEIIKNELGRIVEINVLNPSQIRVSQIKDGKPVKFEWRRSWDNGTYFNNRSERVELDALHVGCNHGIIYKYDNGIMDVPYGRPSYLAGLDPIELEISIYMMHNHGAQNGMFPSMLIAKESSGDPEKDREDSELTAQSMAGVANAGKVGTTYYPQGGSAPIFSTPNLSGIDKVYENQYNTAEAGILKAHGIPSPSLIAGLNVRPSGFASPADELEWAKTELETKIIKPLREEFFEDFEALFIEIGLTPDNLTFDEVKEEEVRPDDIAEPTAMSEKKSVDDLINQSDDDMQGWELISSEEVDYEKEEELNKQIEELNSVHLTQLQESFNDYPKAATENAKKALEWRNKYGRDVVKGGTEVGWARANQLAKKENISVDTIKRMASFNRHRGNSKVSSEYKSEPWKDKGYIAWLIWGGDEGVDWAIRKSEQLDKTKLAGVSTGTARPNAKSEQDRFVRGYQYKVRYKYSGDDTGDREFCSKMLSANKLYRKEDIEMMSANGVNGQFAPKGKSNYDIFLWKGGIYCHHKWLRQTFRKEGKRGSVGTTSPNKVSTGEAQRSGFRVDNNPLVSTRPIDTPTRGRYTFNKIIEWLKN